MALTTGRRIGQYEILSALGAGGMGEVYQARDTQLGRDVAIKVLPEVVAADPDRVARFQREAQLLASLNHPHIGAIYGIAESDGVRALVLELIEGPTLADRIASGPLDMDEALDLAVQIAEALEAAHERGVVHRDLKPANVKLTPTERVKVLDFGLAKMLHGNVAGSSLSMSPTLSVQATLAGVLLGTAAYMSPEQARGKAVDRRTDIWAFGCVLFEMLTGERAFATGDTVSDVVAAILKNEPDWSRLPVATPAGIQRLLRRCLTKDPRERLHDIADARIEIRDGRNEDAAAAGARLPTRRARVAWALVAALEGDRKPIPFATSRFAELGGQFSPDGAWIAYSSNETGRPEIYIAPFGRAGAKAPVSRGGGELPRWRQDGRELFYLAPDGRLMSLPVRAAGGVLDAGAPQPLFEVRLLRGSVFPYAVTGDGQRFLVTVPAKNATPVPITLIVNWPAALNK